VYNHHTTHDNTYTYTNTYTQVHQRARTQGRTYFLLVRVYLQLHLEAVGQLREDCPHHKGLHYLGCEHLQGRCPW